MTLKNETPEPNDAVNVAGSASTNETDYAGIFRQLNESLPEVAVHARNDQFKKDGIGQLGTLYRAMSKADNTSSEAEAWSSLLDLASSLWDHEYHDACLKLLKDAQLRLSPPPMFVDHFKDSIAFAEDYILFLKARSRFEEGDDEGAQGYVQQMSPASKDHMEKEIMSKAKYRSRSRRQAFIAAGIAGAFCLVAVGISINIAVDRIKNPHTMSLPEFQMPEFVPNIAQDLKATPDQRSEFTSQDRQDTKGVAQDATAGKEKISSQVEQIFSGDPPQNQIENLNVSAPETQKVDLAETPEPAISMTKANTSNVEIDSETLSQCALAFRVSAEALRLSSISGDPLEASRAEAFQETFLSGCKNLPIPASELSNLGADVPFAEIQEYARTIVSSD